MKKIITNSIIFLVILLFILLILSRMFIPKNNTVDEGILQQEKFLMGIFAEPENTFDVIILGDSEAYTSFIPLEAWNEYGYTSYVCGAPKQKLSDLNTVIHKVLKKQEPKIVMLETNAIYRKIPTSELWVQPAQRILPIFEYHNKWKTLAVNDLFGPIDYTNIQLNKGFYLRKDIKSGKNKEYMKETTKVKEIPEINKFYVEKIKDHCKSNGAELILYSTPSTKNWNMTKHNGIEQLANEMHLEYIDMNLLPDEIQIDWTKDTRDAGDHLNYSGALKCSKFLAEYLSQKNLPDHKEESSYSYWNILYEMYKESLIENVK